MHILTLILLLLAAQVDGDASTLEKQIRYDMLHVKLRQQVKARKWRDVVVTIEEIRSFQLPLNQDMDFLQGKALMELERLPESYLLLKRYVSTYGKKGKYYDNALAYMLKTEKAYLDSIPLPIEWVFSAPAGVAFTKSEITVAQYQQCVASQRCTSPHVSHGRSNFASPKRLRDHPVNGVSASQAAIFCNFVGGRLPSEEEWNQEASNKGTRFFAWGKQRPNCTLANSSIQSNSRSCKKNGTWKVCSAPAGNSVSGLCDMTGNLSEWTASRHGSYFVYKGGNYLDGSPLLLQNHGQFSLPAEVQHAAIGFRCVREKQK